jgi:hypothetical protein
MLNFSIHSLTALSASGALMRPRIAAGVPLMREISQVRIWEGFFTTGCASELGGLVAQLIPYGQKIETVDKDGELSIPGVASPGGAGYVFLGQSIANPLERPLANIHMPSSKMAYGWYRDGRECASTATKAR